MFGFLRPQESDLFYRSVYSRCCQHQRNYYGIYSLPLLNYDAVFVYLLFIDLGLIDISQISMQKCCRLRRIKQKNDSDVGEFCSSFSMLLADAKLADDIRDERSISPKIIRIILRKKFNAVRYYFSAIDKQFQEKVSELIAEQISLERRNDAIRLTDYYNTTGKAFGYCYSLASTLASEKIDKAVFYNLGEKIGKSIILFDCAVDWAKDKASGKYNPIKYQEDLHKAFSLCKLQLSDAYKICTSNFPGDSLAAKVLASVYQRTVGIQKSLLGKDEP